MPCNTSKGETAGHAWLTMVPLPPEAIVIWMHVNVEIYDYASWRTGDSNHALRAEPKF